MKLITGRLENAFQVAHEESLALLQASNFVPIGANQRPSGKTIPELIVRSAARVEQCFGGLTTSLWDDPYEWTLPESFTKKSAISDYLSEVEVVRINGFKALKSDDDLSMKIATPGGAKRIFDVLLEALTDCNRLLALASHLGKSSIPNEGAAPRDPI